MKAELGAERGARLGRVAEQAVCTTRDQDRLYMARRIEDQAIEMENLLHEKTKEILNQLSDIEAMERIIRIINFEDVVIIARKQKAPIDIIILKTNLFLLT